MKGCAMLWMQKREKKSHSLPLTSSFPHSLVQRVKKLKTGCVSRRWLGCSFSWISRAVYDSSLLGPDGGSLASSVLWVETTQSLSCVSMLHDMSTTQLHLFFSIVFVIPTALLALNQTNKCACFHYAAMGFAE